MHFDNIEIGTSDFRTLIGEATGNGISVEPVPYYFDRLPDRPRWYKDNVAISNKIGIMEIYFCNPNFLHLYPDWIRGCNSVGHVHPSLDTYCDKAHITSTLVESITLGMLQDRHNITSVGLLKIDTEGHDAVILNDMLDTGFPLPERILFESNSLMAESVYNALIKRLSGRYRIRRKQFDTECFKLF